MIGTGRRAGGIRRGGAAAAAGRPRRAPVPVRGATAASRESAEPRWTFLTNHAHVMIILAKNPEIVLREVASLVGITERAVQRIIADLERDEFLVRERVGRRNSYRIRKDRPLRHPIEAHRSIGDLLDLV